MAILHRTLDELVAYPKHDKRAASLTYRATHKHLVYTLDAPCWVCGIRHSTGGAMETHHAHLEWASQFGVDLDKVTAEWPTITDREQLAEWVDSESNMLVLCATHHRSKYEGIHMISYPAWLLQKFQGEDWTFIQQQLATTGPRAKAPLFATHPASDAASAAHATDSATAARTR